ncbi:putative disease resistance protein RGA1 [Trifolium repens]|nr:putative disease resistance protein RGA1 [Trifolium repens]
MLVLPHCLERLLSSSGKRSNTGKYIIAKCSRDVICCSPVGKDDMLLQFSTDKDLSLCKPCMPSSKTTRLGHSLISKHSNEDNSCKSSSMITNPSHISVLSAVKHPKVEGVERISGHELMVREVREEKDFFFWEFRDFKLVAMCFFFYFGPSFGTDSASLAYS